APTRLPTATRTRVVLSTTTPACVRRELAKRLMPRSRPAWLTSASSAPAASAARAVSSRSSSNGGSDLDALEARRRRAVPDGHELHGIALAAGQEAPHAERLGLADGVAAGPEA